MVNLSPTALAAIALLSGAWLALAAWATLRGLGRGRAAALRIDATRHHEALLAASPALPLVVRRDGSLDEAERVALALGLAPRRNGSTSSPRPWTRRTGKPLLAGVESSAAAAGDFALSLRPVGIGPGVPDRTADRRRPPIRPARSSSGSPTRPRARRRWRRFASGPSGSPAALDALSGLIEAAPFPIWHRGPDLRLAMVNSAYVAAVEAEDGGRSSKAVSSWSTTARREPWPRRPRFARAARRAPATSRRRSAASGG